MGLDGTMHHGEAQPTAAGLGRREGFEESVLDLHGNARPIVLHFDGPRRARHREPRRLLATRDATDADRDLPTIARGLQGIEHEIEHGAMQQIFVAVQRGRRVRHLEGEVHVDAAIRMRPRQRHRRAYHIAEVQRIATRRLHAREVEKLREQAREPVRLARNELAQGTLVGRGGGTARELLDGGADAGQRIPDLVRQRRAEFGDRFEALRAQSQGLEALLSAMSCTMTVVAPPTGRRSPSTAVVVMLIGTSRPSRRTLPSRRALIWPAIVACTAAATDGATAASCGKTGCP